MPQRDTKQSRKEERVMPSGGTHEYLNLRILFLIAGYLLYYHIQPLIQIGLFVVVFLVFTYFITPDWDTHSRSTRRAGIIGWIVNKCFKHRGLLHSWVLWGLLTVFGFNKYGFPALGATIAVFLHLLFDMVKDDERRVMHF